MLMVDWKGNGSCAVRCEESWEALAGKLGANAPLCGGFDFADSINRRQLKILTAVAHELVVVASQRSRGVGMC